MLTELKEEQPACLFNIKLFLFKVVLCCGQKIIGIGLFLELIFNEINKNSFIVNPFILQTGL